MTVEHSIIEQYKAGDETQRIFMFLEYRDLRDVFTRIEMDGSEFNLKNERPEGKPSKIQ